MGDMMPILAGSLLTIMASAAVGSEPVVLVFDPKTTGIPACHITGKMPVPPKYDFLDKNKGTDANICNNRSYICDDGSGRRRHGREEELR